MGKKLLLLLVPLLVWGFVGPAALAADVSPSVEACRKARADAWEALRLEHFSKTPTGFELETFLRVAEQCSAASEKAANSRDAAYLAAESALCRVIYQRREGYRTKNRSVEEEKRLYREGIEIVTALDGEHSPALMELLDELLIHEWSDQPKEAVRLLEQRVEIARLEYGEAGLQYVEALQRAAQLYEPSYLGPERVLRGADDPEIAERYYRAALKALAQGTRADDKEVYRELLWSMQLFYEEEGREKEAAQMDRLVQEVYLEIQVDEELSKLDEQEAEAREPESEPESEPGADDGAEEGSAAPAQP